MKVSGSGYAENRVAGTLFGEAIIVILGTILLTLSAKVQVPFYPVPMTLQTMVVVGLGLFLGPVRGSGIVLAYILQGLAGFPVFAGTPPAPWPTAIGKTSDIIRANNSGSLVRNTPLTREAPMDASSMRMGWAV